MWIVGASTRAAAFSALRAGLRPICADLFADVDLQRVCPVTRIAEQGYPADLRRLCSEAPPGPWLYVGALENQPRLVRYLAKVRALWGNNAEVLRRVRRPWEIAQWLTSRGLPCPGVRRDARTASPGRFLVKPLAGAGGRGIRFLAEGESPSALPPATYLQEYIEGQSQAAVFEGDGNRAVFLGATLQLLGEPWLHAKPFQYCGSIGSMANAPKTATAYAQLGQALVEGFGLRGLFGVDCILREGVPLAVEVNPRYTASVEVLEHATGVKALAWHAGVFTQKSPYAGLSRWPELLPAPGDAGELVVGKAIFFAGDDLVVPTSGPWASALDIPAVDFRDYADIPQAGTRFRKGAPVISLFARSGLTVDHCRDELKLRARGLDRWLFGR